MTDAARPATHPLAAAAWMAGTVSCFTVMTLMGRSVAPHLDTFEIMAYRSVFGLLLVLVIGGLAGTLTQIKTNRLGTHILRNVFHFTGQNLWFYSITLIPVAQLIALEFTYPIWVALAAPLFLGERLTMTKLSAALVGFIGILIVVRPGFAVVGIGTITALLSSFGFAGSAIVTKRLTRDQGITCIMFWLSLTQAVFGFSMAGIDGQIAVPSPELLIGLFVIGASGLAAHFCLTSALSLAPASIVTPLDFARLPVIAIAAALIFAEAIDPFVLLGGAVIMAAIFVNLRSESRRASVAASLTK